MRLIYPPLISKELIKQRVSELAQDVCRRTNPELLHVIVVLKGAMFFAADLLRELPPVVSVEFIRASSYQGTNSTGKLEISDFSINEVEQKQVLLIDDIFDTGLTINHIYHHLQQQQPDSLDLCVLLEKKKQREGVNITSDYVGFYIEDNFVVGYGMDYDGKFRNLPDIHILEI